MSEPSASSEPREPRPPVVQGFHLWDLLLVLALTAIALVGWESTYSGAGWWVAGGVAALAGVLYAGKTFFINPLETFSIANSIAPLTTSIFGGLYTTLGPVLGATILRVAEELLHSVVKNGYLVVYGLVLMLSILWLPRGITHLLRRGRKGGDL